MCIFCGRFGPEHQMKFPDDQYFLVCTKCFIIVGAFVDDVRVSMSQVQPTVSVATKRKGASK